MTSVGGEGVADGGGPAGGHGPLATTDIEFDLEIFRNGLAWRIMRVKRVGVVVIGGLASAGLAAALIANSATAGVGAIALRAPAVASHVSAASAVASRSSVAKIASHASAVPVVGNPAGH